jgi:hypothetical protein
VDQRLPKVEELVGPPSCRVGCLRCRRNANAELRDSGMRKDLQECRVGSVCLSIAEPTLYLNRGDVRYASVYKTCNGTERVSHLFASKSGEPCTRRRPRIDKPSSLHTPADGSAVCWT